MKKDSDTRDKHSGGASGSSTHGAASAAARPRQPRRTAQAAFTSYAAPLVEHAIEAAHALHEDASPQALHKLRVALRRLRSLWWAFGPLLEKAENGRQRAVYKYLASAAGKTRDWDILIALLADGDSGAHALSAALADARDGALAVSRETLENADVKHLLRESLSGSAKELNTAHERVPLRKFASRRVDDATHSLAKRIKRASRAKRSDYAAFHDVRKAAKKLRYLLDFFAPDLKRDDQREARRTTRHLKRIQKRFGALNDVVASEELLREHAPSLESSGSERALNWLDKERKRRLRSAVKLLEKW